MGSLVYRHWSELCLAFCFDGHHSGYDQRPINPLERTGLRPVAQFER